MIGGEVTFLSIVVNLGKFVRDLEDHDWRRAHFSCIVVNLGKFVSSSHMFSLYLGFFPFRGRDVITWFTGDRLLTAGPRSRVLYLT
jgi:hypothetical protein